MTNDGARHSQGDICLLAVPYADGRHEKLRPALVISNNDLNRTSTDCIILALTTVERSSPYLVPLEPHDLRSGDLLQKSYVRADAIHTVEQRLLGRRVARLGPETLARVIESMMGVLRGR